MSEERAQEERRLRWRCRRGMLELDLLLQSFLDHGYGRLPTRQRQLFQELLGQSDQALYELLITRQEQADPEVADVIEQIHRALAP